MRNAIENFINAWYRAATGAPEEVGRPLEGDVSSLTSADETDMLQRRQHREPGYDAKRLTEEDSEIGITIVLEGGTEISNRRLDLRKDISKGLGVDRRQVIIHDITTNLDETTIRVQIARVPRQERKGIWDRAFNEMVESEIGGVEVCDVEETTPGQAAEEGYESPDAEANVQDRRGHDREDQRREPEARRTTPKGSGENSQSSHRSRGSQYSGMSKAFSGRTGGVLSWYDKAYSQANRELEESIRMYNSQYSDQESLLKMVYEAVHNISQRHS